MNTHDHDNYKLLCVHGKDLKLMYNNWIPKARVKVVTPIHDWMFLLKKWKSSQGNSIPNEGLSHLDEDSWSCIQDLISYKIHHNVRFNSYKI